MHVRSAENVLLFFSQRNHVCLENVSKWQKEIVLVLLYIYSRWKWHFIPRKEVKDSNLRKLQIGTSSLVSGQVFHLFGCVDKSGFYANSQKWGPLIKENAWKEFEGADKKCRRGAEVGDNRGVWSLILVLRCYTNFDSSYDLVASHNHIIVGKFKAWFIFWGVMPISGGWQSNKDEERPWHDHNNSYGRASRILSLLEISYELPIC